MGAKAFTISDLKCYLCGKRGGIYVKVQKLRYYYLPQEMTTVDPEDGTFKVAGTGPKKTRNTFETDYEMSCRKCRRCLSSGSKETRAKIRKMMASSKQAIKKSQGRAAGLDHITS